VKPLAPLRPGNLAANTVAFARLLRRRGLAVGPREAADALRALRAVDLLDRTEVYLALRQIFVSEHEDYPRFEEAFREFWGPDGESAGAPPDGAGQDPSVLTDPDAAEADAERLLQEWLEEEAADAEEAETPGYSPLERLTQKDFAALTPDELDRITALVARIARRVATRLSRRMRAARRSHLLDMRRTVRHSLRRGGEILELLHRRRRIQKLQVVLLCDVSGSMDLYSRFLVQFIFALQHALGRVETFVFSTSLTRVTDALSRADIRAALDRVARTVPNWSGGTKIGASLREFLDGYGARLLGSRTVVIVISDGWDTGDVDVLEAAMRELRRRSARLIWLNPLLGGPGYEPLCQGMRAALPHVDVFAPAHNLESLRRLERHLTLRG
jgi:uncharacterized protein with von Willebrand factor type A (vWA) domain